METKSNKSSKLIIGILAVLMLAGWGVAGYFIYQGQNNKKSDQSQQMAEKPKVKYVDQFAKKEESKDQPKIEEKNEKEACLEKSKACLKIPKDWDFKFNKDKGDSQTDDPYAPGHLVEEKLDIINDKGVKALTLKNTYIEGGSMVGVGFPVPEFEGTADREVLAYKELDIRDAKGKQLSAEAFVDAYYLKEEEDYYQPVLRLGYASEDKKVGLSKNIYDSKLVAPVQNTMLFDFNKNEYLDYIDVVTGLNQKGYFEGYDSMEEAKQAMNKPIYKQAFDILSTLHRK